jgi:hypothetical protein
MAVKNGKIVPRSQGPVPEPRERTDIKATYYTPTNNTNQQQQKSPVPTGFVFALGLFLIIVSGMSNGQFKSLWDALWNGNIETTFKQDATVLLGELIFILILAFLSEASDDFKHFAIAFLFALWLSWSMFNSKTLAKWFSTFKG